MAIANKRIIDLETEITTLSDDTYLMVDSDTNGTAKYKAKKFQEMAESAATAVEAEATARQAADTAEATARQAADDALQTAIDAKATPADITAAVTAEATARDAAIAAEATARMAAIAAETAAREADVADLKEDLNDFVVACGIPHSKTVTKVSRLNVVANGTAYTSASSNYETFYVPVIANATYIIRITRASGTPGARIAFSSDVPANTVSCAFFVERVVNAEYIEVEYTAQANGYIGVSAWVNNISVSVVETTDGYLQYEQGEIGNIKEFLGISKTPSITKVAGLNVVLNGLNYVYNNNYDTFFIPVYAQRCYTWSVGKSSGSPGARLSFSPKVPSNGFDCTFIEEKAIGNAPAVFEYCASTDGYLAVSVYVNQTNVTLMNVTENKDGFTQTAERRINTIDALAHTQIHIGTSSRTIELDSPSIKARNVIDYQGESTPSTWSGGLAIYKNIALVGYNNGYFAAFDLLSGNLIATTQGSLTSSHNNNLFFDTKQIVNGYPLIYSSYCTEGTTYCDVYELSISDSSMDVTLVQRISYSGDYFAQDQSVDWCYDEENNNIVAIISKNGETVTIVSFAKPDAFMSQILLTDTDIVSVVTNSDITVRQGSVVIDGYLFMLNGYSNGILLVIDLATGNTINRFSLSSMNTHEPEGIAYAHGKIYINMHDGVNRISAHLYELTF